MPSMNESILAMTVTKGSQKAFRILAQRPELAAILLTILKLKLETKLRVAGSLASGYLKAFCHFVVFGSCVRTTVYRPRKQAGQFVSVTQFQAITVCVF